MALTYSSMLDLQTDLIEFDLLNSITGENFASDSRIYRCNKNDGDSIVYRGVIG